MRDFNLTRKPVYVREFVRAMKRLIKEYKEGTHFCNTKYCPLCLVVGIKADDAICTTGTKCDKCAWFIITGSYCTDDVVLDKLYQVEDINDIGASEVLADSRVDDLREWIKLYELFLKHKDVDVVNKAYKESTHDDNTDIS